MNGLDTKHDDFIFYGHVPFARLVENKKLSFTLASGFSARSESSSIFYDVLSMAFLSAEIRVSCRMNRSEHLGNTCLLLLLEMVVSRYVQEQTIQLREEICFTSQIAASRSYQNLCRLVESTKFSLHYKCRSLRRSSTFL